MDQTPYTLRHATERDLRGASANFAQENAFHVDLVPKYIATADPPVTDDEYAEMLADENIALIVAEENQVIVGTALAAFKAPEPERFLTQRRYVYILDLVVDESHRSRGVGRALVTFVATWARSRGASDIELDVWETNDRAIAFYEFMGFTPVRRRMTRSIHEDV